MRSWSSVKLFWRLCQWILSFSPLLYPMTHTKAIRLKYCYKLNPIFNLLLGAHSGTEDHSKIITDHVSIKLDYKLIGGHFVQTSRRFVDIEPADRFAWTHHTFTIFKHLHIAHWRCLLTSGEACHFKVICKPKISRLLTCSHRDISAVRLITNIKQQLTSMLWL